MCLWQIFQKAPLLRHSNAIRRHAGVLTAHIECVLPIGGALYAVEILVTLALIVDAQQIVIDADVMCCGL